MAQTVSPVRTLMVSTSYPVSLEDWRGVFIRHLVQSLSRRDDLALSLWAPHGDAPTGVRLAALSNETAFLKTLTECGGIAHLLRSQPVKGTSVALRLTSHLRSLYVRERSVDLYHVNWLQNALALPDNGKPLLVSVLGTDMRIMSLPGMSTLLRRVLRRRQAAICPNAEWMVPELQRRFGDLAHVRYVPFGIEPRWFEVQSTRPLRPKWLCVSRLTRAKLGDLLSWGEEHFSKGRRELHLLGPMQEEIALPDWVHYHGATHPDALCDRWFSDATGLITLSRHAEGRPQVMLEAMAAGLPIIASRIPAHADLLMEGGTGWLCDSREHLGSLLGQAEDSEVAARISASAKQWVAREVGTWDDCAARYAAIYRDLIQTPA